MINLSNPNVNDLATVLRSISMEYYRQERILRPNVFLAKKWTMVQLEKNFLYSELDENSLRDALLNFLNGDVDNYFNRILENAKV